MKYMKPKNRGGKRETLPKKSSVWFNYITNKNQLYLIIYTIVQDQNDKNIDSNNHRNFYR